MFVTVLTGILGLVTVFLFFYFVPIRLYIAASLAGAGVGIGQLIAMRLRRVPPARVVDPRISGVKAGLELPVDQLESHYLAGGNVERVVFALISAQKAGIHLTFERAAAIDLAGRDVLEAVKMSVNPKVIETPKVSAVAADGIQLHYPSSKHRPSCGWCGRRHNSRTSGRGDRHNHWLVIEPQSGVGKSGPDLDAGHRERIGCGNRI